MPENSWIGCQEYVETIPVALGLDCPSPDGFSPERRDQQITTCSSLSSSFSVLWIDLNYVTGDSFKTPKL